MTEDNISREAKQLAADLDKAPSGEIIIQNLLHAQVLLQREKQKFASRSISFPKGCAC
jgi:hypothetical protein